MSGNSDFFSKLHTAIDRNNSLLCVGLDPQLAHIPQRFQQAHSDPIQALLAWNRAIIDATAPYAAVYKPNIAFYEALGIPGAKLLRATLDAIPDDIPVLLDAKRGDMANTSVAYAQAMFEQWRVDAVTLNAYLGRDSIEPYLKYPGKGLFCSATPPIPVLLTSKNLKLTIGAAWIASHTSLSISISRAPSPVGPPISGLWSVQPILTPSKRPAPQHPMPGS